MTTVAPPSDIVDAARWALETVIRAALAKEAECNHVARKLHAAEATLLKIEAEATGGCDHVRAIVSTYFDSEAERSE